MESQSKVVQQYNYANCKTNDNILTDDKYDRGK